MLGVYYIMGREIKIDNLKKCELSVLSNHERAWLAHQCTFGEKIPRISIFQFKVIKILLQVERFYLI